MAPEKNYASYLLRFRKMQTGTRPTWVASVQSTATGEQRSFPKVEALATFLLAEYGVQFGEDEHWVEGAGEPGAPTSADHARAIPGRSPLPPPKLDRLVVEDNWVWRPRLLKLLDAGGTKLLTLLAAPTGFGKTVLAAQCLARCNKPVAWLWLDQDDDDLIGFLEDVIASIRTRAPRLSHACPTLERLLGASPLPEAAELADALAHDLAALPSELVLVLDDYHLIHSVRVHELVGRLLDARPPSLHLVILAQCDPMLPLARLRAHQQLVELRSADLRFDLDEARRLLQLQVAQPLDEAELAVLLRGTQGWARILRLVILALQRQDAGHLLARFEANDPACVCSLAVELAAELKSAGACSHQKSGPHCSVTGEAVRASGLG